MILGFLALRVLTDRPEDARWLAPEDRDWLAKAMAEDRAQRAAAGHTSVRRGFATLQFWIVCAVFFLNSIVNYGMFLWLPKLLEDVTGARGLC